MKTAEKWLFCLAKSKEDKPTEVNTSDMVHNIIELIQLDARESAIRECASLVKDQWNDFETEVNQKNQAERSSRAILSLLKQLEKQV